MKLPSFSRLSFKLLIPLLLCCIAIIALISIVIYVESQITSEKHVKQQAIEFSESFLMATEVNSSRASIIRTTNSLGTYRGIKELFIIEEKSEDIIASNRNRYVGTSLADLPPLYHDVGLGQVLSQGGKIFIKTGGDDYVFAYRVKILSEDKKHKNSIVILMLLTSEGISKFLNDFRNIVMLFSALALVGTVLIFYLFLKLTLLKRIEKIVNVIENGNVDEELRLCSVDSNDELGVLVMAYNTSLLSDHEHKKELIAANENLAKLSYFDSLTGVSNRRNFDRVLNDEWRRGSRNQQPLTLLMIDVDNFKKFNDRFGHLTGDNCLKAVATTLNQQLKRPGDLLSRYGGEEFSIILPNTAEGGNVVAEYCRKAIEKLVIDRGPNHPPTHVTISIGVAHTIPHSDESLNVLVERADQALYKAKQNGKNQVVLFGGLVTGLA